MSTLKADRSWLIFIPFFLLISACSTTGPKVSSEEESKARAILLTEAASWQRKQEQKILDIGARLMQAAENVTPLKFHFMAKAPDSGGGMSPEAVNAWTDGESVWITRGMMRFLKNDGELAIVLAHEMAHAYRGHMNYLRAKQLLGLAIFIPALIFGPPLAADLAMVVFDAATKKFDRDQEREADLYGLIWASKAGYNIDAGKEIWRRMAIEMPESMERGFLSSHPSSVERFLAMDKVIEMIKKGLDPIKEFSSKGEEKKQKEGKETAAPPDLKP